MAQLFIDKGFFFEFGKLEKSVQDKVYDVFGKFEQATHTGLHLEKVNNAHDSRMRTIRIDQFWRGVVLAPDSGDTYMLLKVLPHDDAYQWAARRKVTVNAAIGVVEIRDMVAIEEHPAEVPDHPGTAPLLADVSDVDLERLGVDEQVRGFARTLTRVDQLESARGMLPEAQYDVLLALAAGYTPEQVWEEMPPPPASIDPGDVATAIARSPQRAVLVTGPDELMEAFTYPFALWRIYLHPTQERAAHASYSGPARVMGGPGTGKTVVALHRARHLAERTATDQSILLTTFTKTLASSLEDGLRILIDDEDLLRRIDIRHIDQLAYQITSREHGRLPVLKESDEKSRWLEITKRFGLPFTDAFLAQEWRRVILAQDITSLLDYQRTRRTGRGVRLGSVQREQVWDAVIAFVDGLAADGVWTYETICVEAARLLHDGNKPYQHIVVDEAQDLAPWQWRLLRAAVPVGQDDLFIAGDTHQRIYDHRVSLRQVGIDIAGRAERLKLNYRTTAEILAWSIGLLHGESIDDMDEGLDRLAGCRSAVHGTPPTVRGFPTRNAELAHLASAIRQWLDKGVEAGQIGVAARTSMVADEAIKVLKAVGIPAVSLAKHAVNDSEVAVGTMHRMKGLEFRCMAVIGVNEHYVPYPSAVVSAEIDAHAHAQDLQRERSLLFVAATRAREGLLVTWHANPSPFLSAHLAH
ncbi:DEAD/DEAH box helicase [Planomonospora sp. ID91781]|uniref:UvrD-helicase domain-containing protein n=1 Tax=Planomonospora sp. ID91781 TaxID=2738135 RepID=UPI0018C40747|nr:UvrD-helicase domain-containing protein [Planomonospora sp. ID91781]MBG0824925.1 DEAD/DEAH box helicase [Planomonospora sp. ID91781]